MDSYLYQFLAEKMLNSSNKETIRKYYLFWIDTILHTKEYELNEFLDCDDKRLIRADMIKWFNNVLLSLIARYKIANNSKCAEQKIRNAIHSRTKHLITFAYKERIKEIEEKENGKKTPCVPQSFLGSCFTSLSDSAVEAKAKSQSMDGESKMLIHEMMKKANIDSISDLTFLVKSGRDRNFDKLTKDYLKILNSDHAEFICN